MLKELSWNRDCILTICTLMTYHIITLAVMGKHVTPAYFLIYSAIGLIFLVQLRYINEYLVLIALNCLSIAGDIGLVILISLSSIETTLVIFSLVSSSLLGFAKFLFMLIIKYNNDNYGEKTEYSVIPIDNLNDANLDSVNLDTMYEDSIRLEPIYTKTVQIPR